jgi:DNA-binding HxlR family transcriptional regulator
MKQIEPRSNCPISYSLDVLGDKWVLLILRDMMFSGKCSYGEFLQSAEKISTNILASKLDLLEEQGFVTKKVDPNKKSKFIYSLTEKSIALLPVLMEITIWGARYSPSGGNKRLLEELKKDREGTIKKYVELIRSR